MIAAVAAVLALHFPPPSPPPRTTTRIRGVQPRGNAVVRWHSRESKNPATPATGATAQQLRSEAFASYGLNINDNWIMNNSTVAFMAGCLGSEQRALKQAEAERAQALQRRVEARLQGHVHKPGGALARDNAVAAARLSSALSEAKRQRCANAPLLRQAESLLPLVERAAIEEYERRRSVGPLDPEAERREALVHALAVHWKARLVASGTGGDLCLGQEV